MVSMPGLKAIPMSFYSRDIYVEVVREWKGLAFGYLFIVIVCTWILSGARLQSNVNTGLDYFKKEIFNQIPTISITKGHISVDKEVPYYIDINNNKVVAFWTGKTPAEVKDETAIIIVLSDRVLVAETDIQNRRTYAIPPELDAVIEPVSLERALSFLRQWFAIVAIALMIPCAFVFCAIQTLLYAAVGKLFAGTMNATLTYGELIRISVMAMTPVLVFDTILKLFSQMFLFWYAIWIVIVLGYLFFGVYANAHAPDMPGRLAGQSEA